MLIYFLDVWGEVPKEQRVDVLPERVCYRKYLIFDICTTDCISDFISVIALTEKGHEMNSFYLFWGRAQNGEGAIRQTERVFEKCL